MIKKLRIRFIVIAMVSVFIGLAIIMTFTNFFNFTKVRTDADDMLYLIEDYDGKLEEYLRELEELEKQKLLEQKENASKDEGSEDESGDEGEEESESESESENENESESESSLPNDEQERPAPDFISKETPYETRFFIVKFDEEITTNLEHIASVSEEEAISLAKTALESGKSTAYQGSYRFLVNREGKSVIFLDCNRQLENAKSFLWRSIFVSLGALLCLLCFITPFSARIVAPIAEGYERQKRFITDAGHELKTPLTIISASNELIELTDGENENTRAISKQVMRMSSMVKNLSALASLDEASRLSQKSSLSLSNILNELCEIFESVIERNGRAFEKDICDNVEIIGDESLIKQLFSILLENAGKYAISKTTISLSKLDKKAVVTISNDAPNVQNGSLNRCFERFYRSDEARASGKEGSGIGLCVAKEITELHGAKITALGQDGVFIVKVII